jgi:hypothetical protein
MTRIVCITSLLAFFSAATVNYAAARDCAGELRTCTSKCSASSPYCLDDCHLAKAKCLAIEERRLITCTPAQGNVQRCVQHGQGLLR